MRTKKNYYAGYLCHAKWWHFKKQYWLYRACVDMITAMLVRRRAAAYIDWLPPPPPPRYVPVASCPGWPMRWQNGAEETLQKTRNVPLVVKQSGRLIEALKEHHRQSLKLSQKLVIPGESYRACQQHNDNVRPARHSWFWNAAYPKIERRGLGFFIRQAILKSPGHYRQVFRKPASRDTVLAYEKEWQHNFRRSKIAHWNRNGKLVAVFVHFQSIR